MSVRQTVEGIGDDIAAVASRTLKGTVAGFVGGLVASWMAQKYGEVAYEQGFVAEPNKPAPPAKDMTEKALEYCRDGAAGALYGGLTELIPIAGVGLAVSYATGLFLSHQDKPPTTLLKPVPTRASVLGSHFVYGVTMDITRRIVRRIL